MKKLAQKSLSILLVLILTVSATVTALAYDAGSDDITGFYASIDAYGIKPKLNWINILLDSRFTGIDENAFAFTLKDSLGKTVADETHGHIETFTPAENDGRGFEVYFYFDSRSLPKLDAKQSYTVTVPAGVFSTDSNELSTQLLVDFDAAEFISTRTGFLGFMDTVYNTPVLRILFAPLIAVIEIIFYIS
ncbi:MAG TPA: hypothetical protein VFD23_04495, partial [Clostridia bacterium]|nr:hypothetical protein [Clostridia bacterium]